MTSEVFLELLGQIDDCYVEEAAPVTKKSKKIWIAVLAAAACVVLAIAIPLTVRSLHTPADNSRIEDNPPALTSGQIDIAASTAATEGTETPWSSLGFVPQYGAFGDGAKAVALSDAQIAQLKEHEDLSLLARCPTLVNPFPADQGGYLVEITPEIRAREAALGQDFLASYYGSEPKDFQFDSRESIADYVMFYENEELEATVTPEQIGIALRAAYEGEMTAEAIAAQPIVKAALEWCGIQTPETREEVNLNIAGDAWEYIFTFAAHSDDPAEQVLNFSFRAVTATVFPAEGLFSLMIGYGEPVLEETETAAVTPEQLDAYLARVYPEDPPAEYVTEIFYSPNVESGKYIPCYRIYLLEPGLTRVAGRIVYTVIEVTTAEITAYKSA